MNIQVYITNTQTSVLYFSFHLNVVSKRGVTVKPVNAAGFVCNTGSLEQSGHLLTHCQTQKVAQTL